MVISNPDDVHTISRRGPLETLLEERKGRTTHPDSRGRTVDPSPSPIRAALKTTASEAEIKTRGEIEAAISKGMIHVHQEFLGRGPKFVRVHLMVDLLLVRIFGVLTVAELQLVKGPNANKGRDVVKQIRTQLIETARPLMQSLTEDVTGK